MNNTEQKFHDEMLNLYEKTKKETSYNATYFLRLITDIGGLPAAKQLLNQTGYPDGLTKLWEINRLDLSMEDLVISDPWNTLFTKDELNIARKRLKELRYLK